MTEDEAYKVHIQYTCLLYTSFVFATQHPCFVTLTDKYMTPHSYYDIAIEGQPKEQRCV